MLMIRAGMGDEAPSAQYDLLRGGGELLDIALLAAKSSAAARQVIGGKSLDSEDKRSLVAIASILESTAMSIEFVETGGRAGSPPSGQFAARFDVTLAAVSHVPREQMDAKAVTKALGDIAEQTRTFAAEPSETRARLLLRFFMRLESLILRETGHPGETTATL